MHKVKRDLRMTRTEVALNRKFDNFLNALNPQEMYSLLTEWIGLPKEMLGMDLRAPMIRSFLAIPNGTIDEFLSFGNDIGIAIELKDKWKTSPGQLQQYFNYAAAHYKKPSLLFLTQSPDDILHRWIAPLFKNHHWYHRTWASLLNFLNSNQTLQRNRGSQAFSFYVTSLGLNMEIQRPVRDYGLNVSLPASVTIELNGMLQTNLPSNGPLGCWDTGTKFWEDVLQSIRTQHGTLNFFSYRFDFYHYMFRWAFHERGIFFDMRKDNKWEYYCDYFKAHIETTLSSAERVTMSTWYGKYLKIPKNQYVKLPTCIVGVVKVNSEDCYFVMHNPGNDATLQRLNFWEIINW